jgi:transcriptional regulator with PAS, ATPase and Fis domain
LKPERDLAMVMTNHVWVKEFPAAITVCDSKGIILEMNDRAAEGFQDQGGQKLIGTNLLECHPEDARLKLEQLMKTRKLNVYTVEKHGVRKLIYQSPWYDGGEYSGFVEISLVIPEQIPHIIRDS